MSVYMVCVTVILGDVCVLKEHYFIISRRYICKHCEKITAATKQAAVSSATLHGLRVRTRSRSQSRSVSFTGCHLRSLVSLAFVYVALGLACALMFYGMSRLALVPSLTPGSVSHSHVFCRSRPYCRSR